MKEPEAAVAIVHADGREESVLLIRRSERAGDPWSGHWSFPGGRRDRGDIDPLHTALRELEEECGIRLGRDRLEAVLPPTLARRKTGPYLLVAPFVFRVDNELPTVPDPSEAVETRWVPLRLLRDPARHCIQSVPGMPDAMAYPCVPLTGPPLWGFTYRLMTEWLGLSPPESAARQAADRLLQFLIEQGLPLHHGWVEESAAIRVAAVGGTIPTALVMERFAAHDGIPPLNMLEVRPDCVRLAGLAFEEYRIEAAPLSAE